MFRGFHMQTERLVLRSLVPEDLLGFFRLCSNPAIMTHLPEKPCSRSEAERILQWNIRCYSQNSPRHIVKFTVGVLLRTTSQLIGWCGLGPLDFDPERMELFYGLAPEFRGRGLATEAARGLLTFAFEGIGLEEVVAVVQPLNHASVRVIEKLGMTYQCIVEGLQPEHSFYEGERMYALRKTDFVNV